MGIKIFSKSEIYQDGGKRYSNFWDQTSAYNILTSIQVLVIGGGGSGGYDVGGGGGAGGFIINNSYSVSSGQSYTLTVGSGGTSTGQYTSPSTQTSNNGNNSVFGSLTANGGGKGGNYPGFSGSSGGSGGGGQGTNNGGSGTVGQGNRGGDNSGGGFQAGGGGGAGAIGGNSTTYFGGIGGVGIQSDITGINTYYCGGGGGGGSNAVNDGTEYANVISSLGGLGGGGKGFARNPLITVNSSNFPQLKAAYMDATPNTGGGGGGTGGQTGGGNGGSGIVVIAYESFYKDIINIGAGLTYTLDTSTRPGYKVYKFTAGTGSISW